MIMTKQPTSPEIQPAADVTAAATRGTTSTMPVASETAHDVVQVLAALDAATAVPASPAPGSEAPGAAAAAAPASASPARPASAPLQHNPTSLDARNPSVSSSRAASFNEPAPAERGDPCIAPTKIVATLGPASSSFDTPAANDPGRRRRGAAQLLARQGPTTIASAPRRFAKRRARPAARSPSWPTLQGPKIRVGKFAEGKTTLVVGQPFILDAGCELGNNERVGLDYKDLPRRPAANDVLLLNDGPDRADGRAHRRRRDPYDRQDRRRSLEQQGHQPPGRRADRAGADGQGHGRHQDGDVARRRLYRGVVPEERDRHGNGAPARQHRGRAVRPAPRR